MDALMTDYEPVHASRRWGYGSALEELARRHVDWVYSAALRQVRDPHMADDVTQAVFLVLINKFGDLPEGPDLTAWIFKVVRYCASHALRAAARRREHEGRAAARTVENPAPHAELSLEQVAPLLDQAVRRLKMSDRQAILLRFYQRKSMAEVGTELGVSEDAAKKRVAKAVERIRTFFHQRGLTPTGTGWEATLLDRATAQAPPATLTAVTALAGQGAAPAGAISIAKGAIIAMRMTRFKMALAVLPAIAGPASVAAVLLATFIGRQPHRRLGVIAPPAEAPAGSAILTDSNPPATTKPGTVDIKNLVQNAPLDDMSKRHDGWFWAINLTSTHELTFISNARKLGLPADATPEQVLEKRGAGDLYASDARTVVPVRGTRIAPLDWPPLDDLSREPQQIDAAARVAARTSRQQIARTILDGKDSGAPRKLRDGHWYGVLRPDGELIVFLAHPTGDGTVFLRASPIGKVDLVSLQPTSSPATQPDAATAVPPARDPTD